MSKEMSVIVLGFWVLVLPYLGIPGSWRATLLVLSGAVIAILGFLLRGETLSRGGTKTERHPFVDNTSRTSSVSQDQDAPLV